VVAKLQDTRYFIFQIRAPGGHDTTFIISTYTINKVINSDNLPFLNYDRDGGHLGINMKNKDFPKIAGF
jgi:hypothetical protein